MSIYDIVVKGRDGKDVSLEKYKGKVLLVVNTATGCGFTPRYESLENIYEKHSKDGFKVLDFPCNQFGNQAPGTDDEIHEFCTAKYNTTFPRFHKVDVNGENESPLFTLLKSEKGFEGFDLESQLGPLLDNMMRQADPNYDKNPSIKWNFTKFLIDREGKVVMRFEPTTDMKMVEEEIEKLL